MNFSCNNSRIYAINWQYDNKFRSNYVIECTTINNIEKNIHIYHKIYDYWILS